MSKVQMLRALVKQRLTAAAEDIFGLFERTIAEYEEELCRSTEEKERQRKLLDAVFNPEVRLHRAEEKERQRKLLDAVFNPEVRLHRADVQQLLVSKEEVPPEQQEWSPLLDREDPPEPPHIKEEEKELWSSQEGERLQGPEEADITKVTVTPVSLKAEDDEEKPQSSQLHQTQSEQMETEAGGEDCGGPEPAGNSDPERHLQPDTDDKTEDSSETEDSDDDWKMSREPQSHFNTHKQNEVTGSHMTCVTGERPFLLHSCSECGKRFGNKTSMKVHMRIHTEEKPFSCLVCGQIFAQGENLRQHMAVHSGKKGLRCAVCDKRFSWYKQFKLHKCVSRQSSQSHQRQTEQIKTEADGEDCGGPAPARNSDPGGHLTPDTDNMTEDSSETDDLMETREPQTDSNTQNKNCVPVSHKTCFTGEKLFSCCKCGKSFEHKSHLKRHMKIHPQEKPFSCSVCGKRFTQKGSVRIHMAMHSGEKQYSCNVCGNRFTWKSQLRVHQCVAESSQLHQRQTV